MDELNLNQKSNFSIERAGQEGRAIVDIKVNGIPATLLVIEGKTFDIRVGHTDLEITFEKIK